MTMKMDVDAIIDKMETGEQDTVLAALQSFNKEVNISSAAWGVVSVKKSEGF